MTGPAGPLASTAGYAEEAPDLLVRYEAVAFETTHAGLLHLFPDERARILDVGAGTGRDAAALAARGHRVVAVEPTAALREGAMALHSDANIRWIDDSLPALAGLGPAGDRFDFVLLVAVWMHLDAPERRAGMSRLTELMAPAARMLLSLRHGPVPPGRRMFDVSAEETVALADAAGLRLLHQDRVASRGTWNVAAGVDWTRLVFERS